MPSARHTSLCVISVSVVVRVRQPPGVVRVRAVVYIFYVCVYVHSCGGGLSGSPVRTYLRARVCFGGVGGGQAAVAAAAALCPFRRRRAARWNPEGLRVL